MRDCARLQDTYLGFYVCISADGRDWGRCVWGIGRQIHTVPRICKKTQRTGRGVPARCTIFSGCFYRTCAIRVPVVIGKWAFCDHLPLSFAFSGWPRSPDFPPKTTTEPIHCVFFPLEITYAKRPRHPPATQAPHGPQPDAPLFARPPQSHTGGDGLICPRALALAKTPRRLTCFPEILYLVYSGADLEGFGPPGVCLVSCHPEESPRRPRGHRGLIS